MSIYVTLHALIFCICLTGLYRSWLVLKKYPTAIRFAKWPMSLLVVLMICSAISIIDLAVFDIVTNQALNILAQIQLIYSAVVAAVSIPYLVRVNPS